MNYRGVGISLGHRGIFHATGTGPSSIGAQRQLTTEVERAGADELVVLEAVKNAIPLTGLSDSDTKTGFPTVYLYSLGSLLDTV